MRTQHILADGWAVKQIDADDPNIPDLTREAAAPDGIWFRTRMPAQVHDILLEQGKIPDPRIGKNAADCTWVGETNWAYACAFPSPAGNGPVTLRLDGIDALATAYLNGKEIARFDNMYRRYTVSVRSGLRPPGEENILLFVFASPQRFLDRAQERFGSVKGLPPFKYLRKCHCDFGSYLGARPNFMKVGIFCDVILDVPDRAWLEDVCVRPALSNDLARADIQVLVEAAGEPASLQWSLKSPSGQEVASGTRDTSDPFSIELNNPELWWPRTHGTPVLYELSLDLTVDGKPCDSRAVPFGIRNIRHISEDPQTGENRFAFEVNGRRIFLRGACWAPLEGMTHCWSEDRAAHLLDLAEHGRMNVFRVWGEGAIPPQSFYDACDRRGILIWQDFMFGYGMHPAGLPEFDATCREEIADMLRRLRSHPCLLMWCGGNENHMGWDFAHGGRPEVGNDLFGAVMPGLCAELDPDRLFHPSSPYGGRAPNWPLEGDWHDYTTLTFSPQASVPLYAAEVGRVSTPSLNSMRQYLTEDEIWPGGHDPAVRIPGKPAWPDMWQYRSVGGSWDKIGPIEEFCDPATAEDLVRVLGAAHGEYLQRRVERHRRGAPDGAPDGVRRCWGNTIWRLNDAWPIAYWSAIDYYLEPKIAYYFLRRAYAPVLVSFERAADRIAVWIVNDSPDPVSGCLILRHMKFDGTVRNAMSADVELRPAESKRVLDATDFGPIRLRDEYLHANFGDQDVSHLLTGERYLHLPQASLSVRCTGGKVEITADKFARQVTLEIPGVTGAVFEDNCFDMVPGQKRAVEILNPAGGAEVCIRAVNTPPVVLSRT